ncbi:MAG: hypothetical protein CBE49_002865 [Rickettsiales bacterium TMED289]|nr:MAG: hypothetical protein CBE49_002865 [Rickettsiales bacterium TMED289]|tara:strand:- start:9690 stop:9899 length:210 start_codon:yes stop_codon:yes gene_type:complete
MVEIRELVIKAKVNGEFDAHNQEVISIINQKIEDYLSRYKFALSNDQKKFLIEECTEHILKKIEIDSKL